jgi:hypothetical protein
MPAIMSQVAPPMGERSTSHLSVSRQCALMLQWNGSMVHSSGLLHPDSMNESEAARGHYSCRTILAPAPAPLVFPTCPNEKKQ